MFRFVIPAVCLLAISAPQPARAGWCEDLWFTRNAILDRAGICFGTVLGQAVFDNTGCTGTSVTLPPEFTQLVGKINEIEARHGCRVDTSQPRLDLKDLSIRQRLAELPIPDEEGLGFGCHGWRGQPQPLYAGRDPQFGEIGRVEPGDSVFMFHSPGGGWSYVTTSPRPGGPLKSGGWMPSNFDANAMCAVQAG